jgi:hypothetical protein
MDVKVPFLVGAVIALLGYAGGLLSIWGILCILNFRFSVRVVITFVIAVLVILALRSQFVGLAVPPVISATTSATTRASEPIDCFKSDYTSAPSTAENRRDDETATSTGGEAFYQT